MLSFKCYLKSAFVTFFMIGSVAIAATDVVQEMTYVIPGKDGATVVIKKPGDAPYCAKKGVCDFPIDCYGNLGAPPKGQMWECKNAPGFCEGQCYAAPVNSQTSAKETGQNVTQKILDLLLSGDAS